MIVRRGSTRVNNELEMLKMNETIKKTGKKKDAKEKKRREKKIAKEN